MSQTPRQALNNRVYGATWRKLRPEILERDKFRCQVRSPACQIVATMVDHRIAVRDGGAWFDPENLQACCRACNAYKAAQANRLRHRRLPQPSRWWPQRKDPRNG
jgi:5-methylcytosine-specific restriction endonuclease McrA